jgi:hypothetical protein
MFLDKKKFLNFNCGFLKKNDVNNIIFLDNKEFNDSLIVYLKNNYKMFHLNFFEFNFLFNYKDIDFFYFIINLKNKNLNNIILYKNLYLNINNLNFNFLLSLKFIFNLIMNIFIILSLFFKKILLLLYKKC